MTGRFIQVEVRGPVVPPTVNNILENTGWPIGVNQKSGQVLVSWNTQGWTLAAPPDEDGTPRKWLPCGDCGCMLMEEMNVVATICPRCEELSRQDRCCEG